MLKRERERERERVSSCVETFYSLNLAGRHINRKSLPLPVHLTWTTLKKKKKESKELNVAAS
jgi:hypothetical protein